MCIICYNVPCIYRSYNRGLYIRGYLFWFLKLVIIIIIIIIEFLTSQLWLGNIHLSWDVVINKIRLGGLICSLKSFLQLNMCQELQIFAVLYMYSGAG